MGSLRQLCSRLAGLFRRRDLEAEMAEEMRQHLEHRTQEKIADGLSHDEARYAAQREFGGVAQMQEQCRDEHRFAWLEQFLQDCSYARRMYVRSPGFTGVILLSLALGIGANAAIFSLCDTVLWKMLPVAQPEQLVFLARYSTKEAPSWRKFCEISYPLLEALERRSPLLAGATTFKVGQMTVGTGGEAESVRSLAVAEDFYSILGVGTSAGRTIQPGDLRSGALAVLSHGYWQRQFAGRPVVGSSIILNGRPHTIIGVAARDFFGLNPGESFDVSVLLPEADLRLDLSPTDPKAGSLFLVVARLKPGVARSEAATALTSLLRQLHREENLSSLTPEAIAQQRIEVQAASGGLSTLRAKYSQPLLALMALVGLVLMITCANVANLLLARATARSREMAIRASLGAGRARLIRQLVTESLGLALVGGLLSILVAQWSIDVLVRLASSGDAPIGLHVTLDQRALLFTLVVSVGTGLLFGLAPALSGGGAGGTAIYGQTNRAASTLPWFSRCLVVGQMALSLVLLFAAGLFVRSLQNLTQLDSGIRRDNVLLVAVDPQRAGMSGPVVADFYQELLTRIATMPGVVAATFERNIPLGGASTRRPLAPAGYLPPGGEAAIATATEEVGPRYFETMGMRIVAGRDFGARDDRNGPKVVVINEAAARDFFPGQNPLGRRIGQSSNRAELEIVGIAQDARHDNLRAPAQPMAYLPALQDARIRDTNIVVRTAGDPLALAPQVRQVIRDTNSRVPIMGVTTLTETAARALVQERLTASLAGVFGGLAIVLAGVGLGGVLLFTVTRRTREIGLRMALGATRGSVVSMIMRESLHLVGIGLLVGVPCAIALGHGAEKLLFGLTPADPITLGLAVILLVSVALLAAFWPARRAAKVDPMVALRTE